jgi:hypothetical protein
MANPAFWPTFLNLVGGSRTAADAFDVDKADLSVAADELLDPDAWPVFSVGLADGHQLHIVMRNFPDDTGVDYVLVPRHGGRYIPLASLEGHFQGPAMSWPELIAAANQPDERLSPAARLLLLHPAGGDIDTPMDADDLLAEAIASIGATRLQAAVASELLKHPGLWSPCGWTTTDNGPTCSGTHSYRQPGGSLTQQQLRLIAEAFGADFP